MYTIDQRIGMSIQKLFSDNEIQALYSNRDKAISLNVFEPNFKPLICLRSLQTGYAFLITQLVRRDDRSVFCLSDYGKGNIKLEVIDINQVEADLAKRNDRLIKDISFKPEFNLIIYAKVADKIGSIITNQEDEKAKPLFEKFSTNQTYLDPEKNLRKFRFDHI